MSSAFGIFMRKYREKSGESLRTMSKRLGISPAFLSAMEVGRKLVPADYLEIINNEYHLTPEEYKDLFVAISESNNKVSLELEKMNEAQKEVSMVFARKIDNADPELLEKLRKVLEEND